jgi:predicted methyltransferase
VIRAAIEHPARTNEDRERDAGSKPAEVLAFVGIASGMRVLDLHAGSGYYTEILARTVGARGRVIAHNHPAARTKLPAALFERRYGADRLPNVEQVFSRHGDLEIAAAALDAVLVSLAYHDLYWFADGVDWGPIDVPELLAKLHRALTAGGIVGVVDHSASPGADPFESSIAAHRIDPVVVRRDFAAAGFELAGDSSTLRNPADDRRRSVFDPVLHGRTDRFVMRFRRD